MLVASIKFMSKNMMPFKLMPSLLRAWILFVCQNLWWKLESMKANTFTFGLGGIEAENSTLKGKPLWVHAILLPGRPPTSPKRRRLRVKHEDPRSFQAGQGGLLSHQGIGFSSVSKVTNPWLSGLETFWYEVKWWWNDCKSEICCPPARPLYHLDIILNIS